MHSWREEREAGGLTTIPKPSKREMQGRPTAGGAGRETTAEKREEWTAFISSTAGAGDISCFEFGLTSDEKELSTDAAVVYSFLVLICINNNLHRVKSKFRDNIQNRTIMNTFRRRLVASPVATS